jgi:hypothetical protein
LNLFFSKTDFLFEVFSFVGKGGYWFLFIEDPHLIVNTIFWFAFT